MYVSRSLRWAWLAAVLSTAVAGCPLRYGGLGGGGGGGAGCPPGALSQPLPRPTTFCRSEAMTHLATLVPESNSFIAAGMAQRHLEQHGYANRTRVFPMSGSNGVGWMVMTFPEALDDQGRPLAGPDRWTTVGSPVFNEWQDYFRVLFRAPTARSRVLIAAATPGGLQPFQGAPSLARFAELTGCSGAPLVGGTAGPTDVTVLDYEFRRVGASASRPIVGAGEVPIEELQAQLALGRCL